MHTLKHGSWLNLIECAFSKMARTFLRHLRVTSVAELKARIHQGIAEMNAAPVVFRWKKFDLSIESTPKSRPTDGASARRLVE